MNRFGFSSIDDDIPADLYKKKTEPLKGEKASWIKPSASAVHTYNSSLAQPRMNYNRAGLQAPKVKPWEEQGKRFTAEESLQQAQDIWDNAEALGHLAKLIGMERAKQYRDRVIYMHAHNLI